MTCGSDVKIVEKKDGVFAARDILSRHPVYYYSDDKQCFCGTSIAEVLKKSGIRFSWGRSGKRLRERPHSSSLTGRNAGNF